MNKKAIICGHVPIREGACGKSMNHLAFNRKEILNLLGSYEGVCIAYFSGHYHNGGCFKDNNNILHITFPAIVEASPDSECFSTVRVYEEKLVVEINLTDNCQIYEISIL